MANIKWSAFPSGSLMQSGDQTVGLRGGLNYRFDFPSTGINNATGTYLLNWADAGAAAVNYLQTSNSISASPVLINALGTDANIGMTLSAKGTGVVTVASNLILNTSAPTTALQAASKGYVDGLMPSYPITLALGGTSANLTASNGGIFYSTSTAGAILSGTATARQMLQSGASSAPAWSTSTWPTTTTINQILYSSATNTISEITAANNGVLISSNTGVPLLLASPGTTGNMFKANTGAPPSWSTAIYSDTYTANNLLYASSTNSVSGLATGNNGVLITSGVGVPSISSTLPSAVQGNITSVGTIGSGTWNASIITGTYGGTGVNNGASTITLGGSLTTSGAFASTFTMTGVTNVTFPTSGTLATTSQLPANPLPLSQGGTNANNTASNGGIVYSSASALNILSGTATANQIILSGSNTTPSWSTATYPATVTQGDLIYASAANVISSLAKNTSATRYISNTGTSNNPAWAQVDLSNGVTGTLPIANGGTGITSFGTGVQTALGQNVTGSGGMVLNTSPTITTPKIAQINDANGNAILGLTPVASAVNYVNITNQATAGLPFLQAAGSDANISLNLAGKATGLVQLGSTSNTPVNFASGTGYQHNTTFQFANTANSPVVTFPDSSGTILMTGQAISTVPSIAFSSTSGVIGTTTNDSAAAGSVGQIISSQVLFASATNISTTTATNLTSISLTAGDWDVWGNIFVVNTGAVLTAAYCGINTTSATLPDFSLVSGINNASGAGVGQHGLLAPLQRLSLNGTTTVYLVTEVIFGSGVSTQSGYLAARRRR